MISNYTISKKLDLKTAIIQLVMGNYNWMHFNIMMESFGAGYRTGFLTFRQEVIPPNHPELFRYVEWAWPRKTDKTGFFGQIQWTSQLLLKYLTTYYM